MTNTVEFVLNAEARNDKGKGASRRLRRTNKVPGIIYGGGQEPTPIAVDQNELFRRLEHEAFYSHILTVNLNGKQEKAVLKDLQRHPARVQLLHIDLQRVSASERLHMHVPLHFVNQDTAPGVKNGGVVTHQATNVEVLCLPQDLPEYIAVEMGKLEIGQSVHLSDLVLPEGVTLVELSHGPEHDLPVAGIVMPRAAREEAPAAAPAEGAASAE